LPNGVIKNTLDGKSGHINARGGIFLDNGGCITDGSVDYWGTITKGGGSNCDLATSVDHLPITLVSFHATSSNGQISLEWTTASEFDNDFFIIEKSKDALNYNPISKIYSKGNTSLATLYSFLDNNPFHGINYYRLKQVDFDGKSRYFRPIAINYEQLSALIYPTIITNQDIVTVLLSGDINASSYKLFSQDGKLIYQDILENKSSIPASVFQYGVNQLIIGDSEVRTSIIKQ